MLTPTPSHAADKKRQSRKHSGDLAWLRLTVCTQIPGKQLNKEYLKDIAQRTGGKYILADNTTELEDIYVTLQKYIINN